MNHVMRLFKEEDGQAMTEYGLLVGLIALAVIAVLVLIGPQLVNIFQKVLDCISKCSFDNKIYNFKSSPTAMVGLLY